jgi:glycosyltransferase involved in cell wall biosynthesis
MKKIIIVYNTMCIGGSTTSLLSILSNLDYKKFKVDLLLAKNEDDLTALIPKEVNLLQEAYPQNLSNLKRRSIISNLKYLYGKMISHNKDKRNNIMGQIMTYENAKFSRKIETEYDVAISFLENFPANYVSKNIKAKRKITWIHVDYIGAGFIPKIDKKCYNNFDRFVLVSEQCLDSFNKSFPQYSDKSIVIQNILLTNTIKGLANESVDFKIDKDYLNIVTVCRITFEHKGLDRVVKALAKLKSENIENNIRWYVIGDGADFSKLAEMIKEYDLNDKIILLGEKKNPFPYVAHMDAFLLPSRYEGKPMAVTEAQMLGIPPVVTEYASAKEQISNMYDGIIVENTDDSIFFVLKNISEDPDMLISLKENLLKNNYDNLSQIKVIEKLIEEESI